jgi:hypothetical protein
MRKSTNVFSEILFFALSALCMAWLFGCGGDDDGTSSVSFSPPRIYSGTYKTVQDWLSPDSLSFTDTVTFDFKSDRTFYMYVNTEKDLDRYYCDVKGNYQFTGDSLILEITNPRLEPVTCAPDKGPEGSFMYYVSVDYLIFEIRDPVLYKQIELYGK